MSYVALGDSLTQGVGDTTNQGGFVSLLAQDMENNLGVQMKTSNFGVSGNTSQQILTRLKEDKDLQEALSQADFMTLTVGGNDVRKVVLNHILDLSLSDFDEPAKEYEANVEEIITLARKKNPNLPIYILGIYNPFYLNFPELTEMQTVVNRWNTQTQNISQKYQGVYFIPINDLLYKGIDGQTGVADLSDGKLVITNDALYSEDSFHPNNTGYEIMKKAVLEKINETKEDWTN